MTSAPPLETGRTGPCASDRLARRSLLLLALAAASCAGTRRTPAPEPPPQQRPTTAERRPAPSDVAELRYDLSASFDLALQELVVDARIDSRRPRSRLYL